MTRSPRRPSTRVCAMAGNSIWSLRPALRSIRIFGMTRPSRSRARSSATRSCAPATTTKPAGARPTSRDGIERLAEGGAGPILQSAEVQPGASICHQTDLDRAVRRVSREAPAFGGSQEELSRYQAGFAAL